MTEQSTSKYENTLTKFEKARVIGQRAKQLSMGAPPLIDTKGLTSAIDIAKKELMSKKVPLIITRTYPNGDTRDFKVSEMNICF